MGSAEADLRPRVDQRRTALLRVQGWNAGADVHYPQKGRDRTGPDDAVWLWRVQHFAYAKLQRAGDRLGGAWRYLCRRKPSWRRRIRQCLARRWPADPQAECLRRLHRGRRVSEGEWDCSATWALR